ncbi:MAG: PAS domain S-box protein [Fibrobacterales bacterium]
MVTPKKIFVNIGLISFVVISAAIALIGFIFYSYNILKFNEHLIFPAFQGVFLLLGVFVSLMILMYRKLKQNFFELENLKSQNDLFNELTNEGIITIDKEGKILYSNSAIKNILGYATTELSQIDIFTKVISEKNGTTVSGVKGALADGRKYYSPHTQCICKDGTITNTEMWLYPFHTEGEVSGGFFSFNEINARVAAFEALEKNQLLLNEAQTISLVGSWEWYGYSGSMSWSAQVYDNFGLVHGMRESTFDSFLSFVHPDDRNRIATIFDAITDKSPINLIEYRIIAKGGEEKYIRDRIKVLSQPGEALHLLGTSQDITDSESAKRELEEYKNGLEKIVEERTTSLNKQIEMRKILEEGLRLKKDELQKVLTASPDIIFHLDSNSIIKSYFCSDDEQLYVKPEQFLNKKMIDMVPPEVGAQFTHALEEVFTENQLVTIEYVLSMGSSMHYFEARINALEDNHCIVIIRDITELVTSRQETGIFSQAVELSPVSVGLTDPLGKIEYVNKKFTEVTLYTSDDALGQNMSILKSGKHSTKFYKEMWETIESGNEWHGELCNKRKDGSLFWEMAAIASIKNSDGSIAHYIAVKEDITEQKAIIRELQDAKKRAVASNRAKSTFLASMSHELRTPLNSILGFSQLLEKRAITNKLKKEGQFVEKIRTAGEHLLSLITDILDLAKIESGSIALDNESVSLNDVVREALDVIRHMADERSIEIADEKLFYTSAEGCFVHGDYLRIKQVMINVLSNAVKYNISKGEIELSIDKNDESITLNISDTGYGIAPEYIPNVFEPFNRLGIENTNIEGTGIGLTLCKKLMAAMNGTIELSKTSGTGSTFAIKLPRSMRSDEELKQLTVKETGDLTRRGSLMRVLYIEDNESNRELVRELLGGRKGIELLEAVNGQAGIDLYSTRTPQVVLLDISLPDMSGYEVIEKIREISPDQYVVALTANALPSEKRKAKRAGFNDYITKPINISEFYKVLDTYL